MGMPESYETPSLFGHEPDVSDSPEAAEVITPTGPSIAERTGYDPNEPDHGRDQEIVVEPGSNEPQAGTLTPEEQTRVDLDFLRGDTSAARRAAAEARALLAANRPADARPPIRQLPEDFDSTIFDADQPEWPIPNRPSR